MTTQTQSETVEFLMRAGTLGSGSPDKMETHISLIFLAGDRAFKMKRAVELPYADFSTPELREATCEKEVRLNARTAPDLYLGVRRITRQGDGRLALNGEGETVDALVEMHRFDQECLFDRMAVAGRLTPELMGDLAHEVARFHAEAPLAGGPGGAAGMAAVLDINEAGFTTGDVFGDGEVDAFNAAFRAALETHRERLDERAARGRVRRCHGDLHLRNICLLDGAPRLFDCIEFNDDIATVDVLYDLAFLLMDLWHRDLAGFANLVANRYLDATDEDDGFALLPFFMAVRAAVRAHVTATQAGEGAGDPEELARTARSYFDLALSLLEPGTTGLVAIGGLSGSGKTTVAEALAPLVGPPPGARVVGSDRVRKAMFDVPADTRLPDKAYAPDVSEKVYAELAARSGAILADGAPCVVDAVFDRPDHRDMAETAARRAGAPFTGIWLDVEPNVLRDRVRGRRGGPSDATLDVLERQLARAPGELAWERIEAAETPPTVVERIRSVLAAR